MFRKTLLNTTNIHQNWCWGEKCGEKGEILSSRKNILLKSTTKKSKGQKTSLKKRSRTTQQNNSCGKGFTGDVTFTTSPTKDSPQPRNGQWNSNIIVSKTWSPIDYQIGSTPEKKQINRPKVTFMYSTVHKETRKVEDSSSNQNVFVGDKNKLLFKGDTCRGQIIRFTHGKQMTKSTQISGFNIENEQEELNFDKQLKLDSICQLPSQKIQSSRPIISLSSRKKTIMSIDGDSQSMQSFAVFDSQDQIPLLKLNSMREPHRRISIVDNLQLNDFMKIDNFRTAKNF